MFGRSTLGAAALGTGLVGGAVLLGSVVLAGPASADVCSCPTAVTAAASSSGSLPFTGFDASQMALLGAAALAAGGGLILLSRRRGALPVSLTLGGAAVAAAIVLSPFSGVADAATVTCACPATPATQLGAVTTPASGTVTTTPTGPVTTPGGSTVNPVVPESPYVALLPLAGITMAGAVLVRRQHRSA